MTVAVKGKVYLFGVKRDDRYSDYVYEYNIVDDNYNKLPNMPFKEYEAAMSIGNNIYLSKGTNSTNYDLTSCIVVFNVLTNDYVSAMFLSNTVYFSGKSINSYIYFFMGGSFYKYGYYDKDNNALKNCICMEIKNQTEKIQELEQKIEEIYSYNSEGVQEQIEAYYGDGTKWNLIAS